MTVWFSFGKGKIMDPEDSFLGQCLLWFGVVYQYDSWGGVCAPVKPPVQ